MAREQYHKELKELKQDILKIGELTIIAVRNAVLSLKEQNEELATKVIKGDHEIDDLGLSIEKKCMRLIALQQPMARDLRMIVSALKIIIDIERIGDLALEISKIAIATIGTPHIKPLIDIPRMSEIICEMMKDAMIAFDSYDVDLAYKTAKRDDEVDALFDQTRRELITYMIEDPKKITNASHLQFTVRYLERMGDHVTNICESVIYMITGNRVELN
ncbi:MAG: phosphate signaling complex protein PhoU [Methanosarcinales archaeon]